MLNDQTPPPRLHRAERPPLLRLSFFPVFSKGYCRREELPAGKAGSYALRREPENVLTSYPRTSSLASLRSFC